MLVGDTVTYVHVRGTDASKTAYCTSIWYAHVFVLSFHLVFVLPVVVLVVGVAVWYRAR